MDAAVYMQEYTLRGQHTPDRAMTRYKNDLSKMVEDQEISTGPGRWTMGVPNVFANAAFIPTPTIVNQRWGASHNMESTKTDMESDLRNLGRPTVRSTCGQYTPGTGLAANAMLTPMPEVAFPQVASHLCDPPSTLRGTGFNRWEWLDTDPQQQVFIPFEHSVNTQMASKDRVYERMTTTNQFGPSASSLASSAIVREHGCIPGSLAQMDNGLPVPRAPRVGEPLSFNNYIPGARQQPVESPPIARETPRGFTQPQPQPQQNQQTTRFPTISTWNNPDQPNMERIRAQTGVLASPPSTFILPA